MDHRPFSSPSILRTGIQSRLIDSPSRYFWCTDYAFHLLTLCQKKNALTCGTEERQTPHPFIWFSLGVKEQEYFWDMACWCCRSVLGFQQHVMSGQQLLGPRVTQRFCPSQSFIWLKKQCHFLQVGQTSLLFLFCFSFSFSYQSRHVLILT